MAIFANWPWGRMQIIKMEMTLLSFHLVFVLGLARLARHDAAFPSVTLAQSWCNGHNLTAWTTVILETTKETGGYWP